MVRTVILRTTPPDQLTGLSTEPDGQSQGTAPPQVPGRGKGLPADHPATPGALRPPKHATWRRKTPLQRPRPCRGGRHSGWLEGPESRQMGERAAPEAPRTLHPDTSYVFITQAPVQLHTCKGHRHKEQSSAQAGVQPCQSYRHCGHGNNHHRESRSASQEAEVTTDRLARPPVFA